MRDEQVFRVNDQRSKGVLESLYSRGGVSCTFTHMLTLSQHQM